MSQTVHQVRPPGRGPKNCDRGLRSHRHRPTRRTRPHAAHPRRRAHGLVANPTSTQDCHCCPRTQPVDRSCQFGCTRESACVWPDNSYACNAADLIDSIAENTSTLHSEGAIPTLLDPTGSGGPGLRLSKPDKYSDTQDLMSHINLVEGDIIKSVTFGYGGTIVITDVESMQELSLSFLGFLTNGGQTVKVKAVRNGTPFTMLFREQ